MTPSQALAELQAAINIYHFVSKEAKEVLKAIHEGKHDPAETPAPAAGKAVNAAAKAPATKVD